MVRCLIARLYDSNRDDSHTRALTRAERRCVKKYTQNLPEPQRTIFLSRLNGMTPQEISNAMGMDREAVTRALAKAYADLRVALAPN